MRSLKVSEEAWKFIILNFIIKLFLFKNLIINISYNSILIITNRLTKYIYFINYLETSNIEDLIYIFLQTIFVNYNILVEIILNWNKLFILKFWKLLIDQLKTKYKLLIIYYLQTNKQTERIN